MIKSDSMKISFFEISSKSLWSEMKGSQTFKLTFNLSKFSTMNNAGDSLKSSISGLYEIPRQVTLGSLLNLFFKLFTRNY